MSKGSSTRTALAVVYLGYSVRYLSLIVLIPYYGRVLGPAEYGKVLIAMSLMGVIWMIVNFGFSAQGVRDVAGVADRGKLAAEIGRHVSGRLLLVAVGAAVGTVATVASPVLRAEAWYGVAATTIGVLSGFNLGWYFQGTRQYVTSILLEVAVFVLHVSLVLSLVKLRTDGIYVLLSLVLANLGVVIVAYLLAWRQLGGARVKLHGAVKLIHESTSLFLLSVVPTLALMASSYLLSLFASAQQVGHYGSAERLATAVLSLFGPANQVMLATVAAQLNSSEDSSKSHALMRKGILWMSAFGTTAMLACLLLAPYIIALVFGPEFGPSVPVLRVLALSFPFAAFAQAVCVYVLVPMRRERVAVRVTLWCALIQLLALLVLAQLLGGIGAALSRALTDVLNATLLLIMLWKMKLLPLLAGSSPGPSGSRP